MIPKFLLTMRIWWQLRSDLNQFEKYNGCLQISYSNVNFIYFSICMPFTEIYVAEEALCGLFIFTGWTFRIVADFLKEEKPKVYFLPPFTYFNSIYKWYLALSYHVLLYAELSGSISLSCRGLVVVFFFLIYTRILSDLHVVGVSFIKFLISFFKNLN